LIWGFFKTLHFKPELPRAVHVAGYIGYAN